MALKVSQSQGGISVRNLSFMYPQGTRVFESIDFDIPAGSRVLLAGATGSGKSTLLRCLKPELTPHGTLSGEILVDGERVHELGAQRSAGKIGFVLQDPRQQIVMDTVKAELAFGLENLGTPQELIQRRVAEIANYFGINDWVDRNTSELSGGEMQLVNLASIIAMQPRTLLLDEPTSMLDPIAARGFIELVERVNNELGITILMVEHQQEDLLARVNQVLYLQDHHLAFNGWPRAFAAWLKGSNNRNWKALPVATQLFLRQPYTVQASEEAIPLDVKEGRWWIWQRSPEEIAALDMGEDTGLVEDRVVTDTSARPLAGQYQGADTAEKADNKKFAASTVLEAKHVWFRHSKESPYILKDLSLKVAQGTILGIVGANASGKSTLLTLLAGAYKPQHGKVSLASTKRLGMLPQDPTALFIKDTVHEDLMDHAKEFGYGTTEATQMLKRIGLEDKDSSHPFDLSGGEQQKLACAKLLLTQPDILLLDEPTKGLDAATLGELRQLLRDEAARGTTIIMVSHDLEFVAATARECLMLFDGGPVGRAPTKEFFTGNMFYTTALQRLTQGILTNCPPVLDWQEP